MSLEERWRSTKEIERLRGEVIRLTEREGEMGRT